MNKRFSDITTAAKHLNEVAKPVVQTLSDRLQHLEASIKPFIEQLEKISKVITPYIRAFAEYDKIAEAFRATGWLPYRSAPFHYVEECGDDTPLLEKRLSDYYRVHWNDIRQDIESRLTGYHIDDEAKETFREALDAHEMNLYRSTCRVLLPEIERVFRVQFFNNETGNIYHGIMEKIDR